MVATRFPTVQLNFARPAEQWTEGVGQGLQPLSPLAEGEDIRPRTGLSLRPEARVGRHRPHRQACRLHAYRLLTIAHNRKYQMLSPAEQYFRLCFEVCDDPAEGEYMSTTAIFQRIKRDIAVR